MRLIAVDGPTGVGKSTTAMALAEALDAEVLLDPVSHSPLLDDYYIGFDTPEGALHLEREFLRMRSELLAGLSGDERTVVSDFSVGRSGPFAELLAVRAHRNEMVAAMRERARSGPRPAALVLLRAEPEQLLDRVRRRNRPAEAELSLDHLRRLCASFATWEDELFAQADRHIVLDTHDWDPARPDDLAALVGLLAGSVDTR